MPEANDALTVYQIVYLALGVISVLALSATLTAIGRAARSCPVSGAAAGVATLGVTGAFAAIGLGVVSLIGAVSAEARAAPITVALGQYGSASVMLGIAFAIAAVSLREALSRAVRERLAADKLARHAE